MVVGPEVVLQTPVLGDPAPNATVGISPTLNVNNVGRSGPVTQIVYRFDISEQSDFSSIAYSGSVNERGDLPYTPLTVAAQLAEKTYYWRVQATDLGSGVTSPFSNGSPIHVQPFNMRDAVIWDNPADLGSWAETSQITSVQFTDSAFLVDFDKRDRPRTLAGCRLRRRIARYTRSACASTSRASGTARRRSSSGPDATSKPRAVPTRSASTGGTTRAGARLVDYQPAFGETVGIFTAAGNLRDNGNVITKERTNVVLMPFGGSYSLNAAARRLAAPFFRR